MRKRQPIVNYLELGVAAGTRVKKLAQHSRESERLKRLVGIDVNRRVRAKSDLPVLEIKKGTHGEAVDVLSEMVSNGTKVKVVNADFFFSDVWRLVKIDGTTYRNLLSGGKKTAREYAILTLLEKAMAPNGRLYITDFADNIPWLEKALPECGFKVERTKKLSKKETPTWWGKLGFRWAKEKEDKGWEPVRLVAVKRGEKLPKPE